MAIKHRRGQYSDFDPSKMVAGEVAVVQSGDPNTSSGKSMYIAPTSGSVKRLAFVEDVEEIVYNLTESIAQEINDEVADDVEAAQTAAREAARHVTHFTDANSDGNIVITIGS